MLRSRALLVLLCLPVSAPACGGAIESSTYEPGTTSDGPSSPSPRRPRPSFDASFRDSALDAVPGPCTCTENITQVEGTCRFTIEPRLVECAWDIRHEDAGSSPTKLDLVRSCIAQGPPSWTPSAKVTELELCSCTPGEKHSLCVRYR